MALYPGDPKVTVDGLDLEALAELGLYVREEDVDYADRSNCYEGAICRVSSTLVQAVAIALASNANKQSLTPITDSSGSWCDDVNFDVDEARIALGGIAAILRHLPRLVTDLRCAKPPSPEDFDDDGEGPSNEDEKEELAEDDELDPSDPQRCNLPKPTDDEVGS